MDRSGGHTSNCTVSPICLPSAAYLPFIPLFTVSGQVGTTCRISVDDTLTHPGEKYTHFLSRCRALRRRCRNPGHT
ncbi:unnamed protein product [Acanthoscelides obtectus]|uniref:Uncharacterized protein n=1 Tax=Acanthoscelides obtectus TaxID=200917 RepID=A0A9P0KWZ0_ACAOB|nr:unnamed protein product [Acanthoscelides obtectus]CAK1650667.1 hypothetical protein AOBTE_LOCUS16855 [Acanthoscelides obtectus]